MTQYSILGRLRLMVELDEQSAMEALPFCAAAMEQLAPRLKVECRNDPRLDQAAAAMACCMLLQRTQNAQGAQDDASQDGFGAISSFKAGDISITKGQAKQEKSSPKDRMAYAEQARKAAMEDIRDLLRDTGFYAGQVSFKKAPPVPPSQAKGADRKGRRRHGH